MALVQAKKASVFTDSVGVNVHVGYPQYQDLVKVIAALQDIGIKHVRDGGRNNIGRLQQLGSAGIKTLYITNPYGDGTVPNSSYVITKHTYINNVKTLVEDTTIPKWTPSTLVANIGISNLDGIEAINEIDINCYDGANIDTNKYKWSQADQSNVVKDRTSAYSWINYIDKYVKDLNAAVKGDANISSLPVVAGALGGTYTFDGKNPMKPIGASCDFGNGHYYENGGNGFNDKQNYAGITAYYQNTTFPGNLANRNLAVATGGEDGNSDLYRQCYEQPFNGAPMWITECGWSTSASEKGLPYSVHGKYVPRLFVEYFRLGFARSYWYEFVNLSSNADAASGREQSFGMLQTDFTYKPGAVQLKALMDILKDTDNRSAADSLDYTLALTMPSGYTKSNLVKQVLLQKADGTFVLLVYHNIASAQVGNSRDIPLSHPDVAATLTLPGNFNIRNTTLRSDAIAPATVSVAATNSYTFTVNDTVTILELEPVVASPYVLASIGNNANSAVDASVKGQVLLTASGADIWGTSDSFSFYHKPATSAENVVSEVKLDSLINGTDKDAKAGIMVRDSLAANDRHITILGSRANGVYVQSRSSVGGVTTNLYAAQTKALPEFLRLSVQGSSLVASISDDGATWTVVYSTSTFNYGTNILVGLACTAHNNTQVTTAKFTNVKI